MKTGNKNPNWRGGKEKECTICNSFFWVKPSHWNKRITCSRKCQGVMYKKSGQYKGNKNPMFGKVTRFCIKKEVACARCAKKIILREKYLKNIKTPYCSKFCLLQTIGKRDKFGSKNPAWIDGSSFLPYPVEFNAKLKQQIKKRDGAVCRKCGKTEIQEKIDFSRGLAIHHIDYVKNNCNPKNLTVLCLRCNSSANYNREEFIRLLTRSATVA